MARRRRPYKVKHMHFPDFVDCKALSSSLIKNRSKDDHGAQVNWLKKVLRFEKSAGDCIQYKYRYDDAFTKIFVKQIGLRKRSVQSSPTTTTCLHIQAANFNAEEERSFITVQLRDYSSGKS